MKHLGLYIHIPFCQSKCHYCDFASFVHGEEKQRAYLDALLSEINLMKDRFRDKTFDSIFIGGGTPSVVYDGFILTLVEKLKSCLNITPDTEFTIEVNPNTLTENKLHEYEQAGINRISMGVQNINSRVLSRVGRHQTKRDIEHAFSLIHNSSIKNINCDVMLGLPSQSIHSIKKTIKYIFKQGVTHISAYTLQLEKGTPLHKEVAENTLKPATEEKTLKMYDTAYKLIKQHGFTRYEISNFALPNYECRHNMKYWDNTEYLGLGLSAHSYIKGERTWNTKNLDKYISTLNNNTLPIVNREKLTLREKKEECIMLALRTARGLDLKAYERDFSENLLNSKNDTINALVSSKMLEIEDDFLKITEPNFNISNSIIIELID